MKLSHQSKKFFENINQLEITFRKEWIFLSKLDLSEAINSNISNPYPCGFE